MKNMVTEKSPLPLGGIPARNIPTHQTLSWKTSLRKMATHKILTGNIPIIS